MGGEEVMDTPRTRPSGDPSVSAHEFLHDLGHRILGREIAKQARGGLIDQVGGIVLICLGSNNPSVREDPDPSKHAHV